MIGDWGLGIGGTGIGGKYLPVVGVLCVLGVAVARPFVSLRAHDLERTQVVIRFARDGSFVVDVSNDPVWLHDRMQSIPGPFADRIVLWVDGREIRPAAVEYIAPPPAAPGELPVLGIHHLRGTLPVDAKTLRWYYGLVIDPYPLTIHRADGRIVVEEVAAGAWSDVIDLSNQFRAPTPIDSRRIAGVLVVAVLLVPPIVRLWRSRR